MTVIAAAFTIGLAIGSLASALGFWRLLITHIEREQDLMETCESWERSFYTLKENHDKNVEIISYLSFPQTRGASR